jgi:hypothetical protein
MTAENKQSGKIIDKGFKYLFGKELRVQSGFGVVQEAPAFFDHFITPQTIATNWVTTVVNGGTAAILNGGIGGIMQLTCPNTTSGDAVSTVLIMGPSTGSSFTCAKAAKDRPVVFEARIILPANVTQEFVFGFRGVAGRATAIDVAISATSTLGTSVSADIAALAYSTVATSNAMASGVVGAIASLNGVDATTKATFQTMDTNYHVYRVELDVNGNATYLIDGKFAAYQPLAFTPTAAIYPGIETVARGAVAASVNVDYAYLSSSSGTTST